MLTDKLTKFYDNTAVTTTARSNVIDLSAYRDIGTGEPLEVFIQVTEGFTADGAGTLTVALQCDDNEAFNTPTTLATTAAIGKATLVVGYKLPPLHGLKIPAGCERYVSLLSTVATGPMTAGKLAAGIVIATQSFRAYPNIAL